MKIDTEIHPAILEVLNRNLETRITVDSGKGIAIAIQEVLQKVAEQAWAEGSAAGEAKTLAQMQPAPSHPDIVDVG